MLPAGLFGGPLRSKPVLSKLAIEACQQWLATYGMATPEVPAVEGLECEVSDCGNVFYSRKELVIDV